MASLFIYKRIGAASFLLFSLSLLLAESVQSADATMSDKSHISIDQDPKTWRREPFVRNLNKGTSLNNITIMQQNMATKRSHHTSEQSISLQGIIQSDKTYHALINGRTVKAGDVISGITIKEISRFRVIALNGRKEKITYDIYQGKID